MVEAMATQKVVRYAKRSIPEKHDDQIRIEGVVDHIAIESQDLKADAHEYMQLGFNVEALYDDWALLKDSRGFGLALLAPGSKYPPHLALRVESLEALEEAARRNHCTVREHRDHSFSFHTEGIGGHAIQVIYYPPEHKGSLRQVGI
jgi:hypothetical protein